MNRETLEQIKNDIIEFLLDCADMGEEQVPMIDIYRNINAEADVVTQAIQELKGEHELHRKMLYVNGRKQAHLCFG